MPEISREIAMSINARGKPRKARRNRDWSRRVEGSKAQGPRSKVQKAATGCIALGTLEPWALDIRPCANYGAVLNIRRVTPAMNEPLPALSAREERFEQLRQRAGLFIAPVVLLVLWFAPLPGLSTAAH